MQGLAKKNSFWQYNPTNPNNTHMETHPTSRRRFLKSSAATMDFDNHGRTPTQ